MVFAMRNVNKRLATTASETYQTCKLELLANNLIDNQNTNSEVYIKQTMVQFLETLKGTQWNCTNALLAYENHRMSEFNLQDSWYQFLLDSGQKIRIPLLMNSAVFEFVNGIEYLSSS